MVQGNMRNKNLSQILKTSVEFTKSEINSLKGELSEVLAEMKKQQDQMLSTMQENRKQLLETLVDFRNEQRGFISENKIENFMEEEDLQFFKGPKGDKGPKGPKGSRGLEGPKGKPFLYVYIFNQSARASYEWVI